MQDFVEVTGMVLKSEPIGEYDRRVVILSLERGKITCFAKGARKVGSRFMASTNAFCFGTFRLFQGRSSYSLNESAISHYFEELRSDYDSACYGMYFLELMDYYTLENNDERAMLTLLFQSVRALLSPNIDNRLIRYIFEIKALALNGEYPGIPENREGESYDPSTIYTVEHVVATPAEKLYQFRVSDRVLSELAVICRIYRDRFLDRKLKSLEMLEG